MKLSRKQLYHLLDHPDSPYIRGLGFIYIRYTQSPDTLWDWYEPYLEDEEEVDPKAGGMWIAVRQLTIGFLVFILCQLGRQCEYRLMGFFKASAYFCSMLLAGEKFGAAFFQNAKIFLNSKQV